MKHFSKWRSKLLALVLALTMLVALAACGGGNTGNTSSGSTDTGTSTSTSTDTTTTDTATTDATTDTPTDAAEDLAVVSPHDLGGRVIKIANWETSTETYGMVKDAEEPDPETTNDYYVAMLQWENANRVFDEYNFSFEDVVIDFGEVESVLTTSVLAGDPVADIIMIDRGWQMKFAKNGLLEPMNDFLPADHDIFTSKTNASPASEYDGKVYAMSFDAYRDNYFIGVNLDIIRAEGLPNPAELYDRGEWTYDAFMNIARTATKDTTGDGIINQFGFSGALNEIMKGFVAGNDGSCVNMDGTYGYDSPKTMVALEMLTQIFSIDRVWNDSLGIWGDWNAIMFDMPWEGNTAMFVAALWTLQPDPANRTFEYTVVPFPKGPDNPNHAVGNLTGYGQGWGIPRGTSNPEEVIDVMIEFRKWYGTDYELKAEQDLAYMQTQCLTEADADRLYELMSNMQKFDLCYMVPDTDLGYTICGGLYEGTGTAAQIVEENRQPILDLVNEFMGS